MIRKLPLLALLIVVLAVFTDSGNAQDHNHGEAQSTPAAGPTPNDVKLFATPNVASVNGCPMTAWVHNQNYSNSGYSVKFYKVPPGVPSGYFTTQTSDANGKTTMLAPWSTTIVATVQSQTLLTSNTFTCPANPKNPPKG